MTNKTDFGFKQVPTEAKSSLVGQVFDRVAPKYDLMNDLMSLGLHRIWKKFTIDEAAIRPGQHVLDVASGTGDLAMAFVPKVTKTGKVILTDINKTMLSEAKARFIDKGIIGNVEFVVADAENLPFPDNHFDLVTIAFGLRNVTHKAAALRSMFRVLKPGGKLLVLEFSKVENKILQKIYDAYSFNIIPRLGKLILNDKESYQYLVESIRMHPDQECLKQMLIDAGFDDVNYFNLCQGVVALHKGYKY